LAGDTAALTGAATNPLIAVGNTYFVAGNNAARSTQIACEGGSGENSLIYGSGLARSLV
jgi:hypothetical protein